MLETDAPYLLPRDLVPAPKSRRNEPSHLPHIARTVAQLRGESLDAVAASTTRNAERFFGLEANSSAQCEHPQGRLGS
jgi:TatD DNase family protein